MARVKFDHAMSSLQIGGLQFDRSATDRRISISPDEQDGKIDLTGHLTRRLAAGPFQRTHRSFVVNIDKIAEIRMADTGARIILTSGEEVPLSRGYRDEFTRRVGG